MTTAIFWCFLLASCGFALGSWAVWSLSRVTALLHSHSLRSAMELSASVTATQSSLESLSKTVRRLSSRYGMAEHRAKDGTRRVNGEIPLDELQGEEFRREARKRLLRAGQPVKME